MAIRQYNAIGKTCELLAAADELTGKIYTYDRVGYDCRAIVFRPDGTVGLGRGGREVVWDLRRIDGEVTLIIASADEITCKLKIGNDGVWRGRWLHAEKMPIAVYAAGEVLHAGAANSGERYMAAPAVDGTQLCYSAVKAVPGGIFCREFRARVYGQAGGHFERVTNSNVLVYFRHGFGDLVQFSCVLPLLNRSNRYWLVRFGDDYTSLMEGSDFIIPVYLGVGSIHCDDGGSYGVKSFGIDPDARDGSVTTLGLPLTLYDFCCRNEIDTVLQLSFPEQWGANYAPLHTKARHTLRELVNIEDIPLEVLSGPLPSAINFEADKETALWVETKLRNMTGFGERKLCLVSRNGYSAVGKNWGHRWREDLPQASRREGEEARDFMRLMLRKDPRWVFLVMEDAMYHGDDTLRSERLNCYSFAELFGVSNPGTRPFGAVMKTLTNLADLSVGVPTGPYHLSMVKAGLPTIGLWIEHLPSWYDEAKEDSVHVFSRNIPDARLDRRPGSVAAYGSLRFRALTLDTRIIPGERVLDAVEMLLG